MFLLLFFFMYKYRLTQPSLDISDDLVGETLLD